MLNGPDFVNVLDPPDCPDILNSLISCTPPVPGSSGGWQVYYRLYFFTFGWLALLFHFFTFSLFYFFYPGGGTGEHKTAGPAEDCREVAPRSLRILAPPGKKKYCRVKKYCRIRPLTFSLLLFYTFTERCSSSVKKTTLLFYFFTFFILKKVPALVYTRRLRGDHAVAPYRTLLPVPNLIFLSDR